MITTTIQTKAVSIANLRLHFMAKARLTKSQRVRAKAAMSAVANFPPSSEKITVVLTRVGPKALDSDNLASSLKATRDGIADWLGIDDGSVRLDWQYRQRSDGFKVYAVEVEVL